MKAAEARRIAESWVDDTAAYLNSGGECGCSEPYASTKVLLRVS